MDSTHDYAITAEDLVIYTLTADQMSHATVVIEFQDQTSPDSTVTDPIIEMTRDSLNIYPAHAAETKVYLLSLRTTLW